MLNVLKTRHHAFEPAQKNRIRQTTSRIEYYGKYGVRSAINQLWPHPETSHVILHLLYPDRKHEQCQSTSTALSIRLLAHNKRTGCGEEGLAIHYCTRNKCHK